jgi:hypothetical protein
MGLWSAIAKTIDRTMLELRDHDRERHQRPRRRHERLPQIPGVVPEQALD